MSVLEEICAKKREHVDSRKSHEPLSTLKEKIKTAETPRGFLKNLKQKAPSAIIAEVKKASPSKGVIRNDFDPTEIAKDYEASGAACLSVLTDEPYFKGHDDYLKDVKAATALSVLRKDFMIDPYQIYESRALGADCILLIMAALDDSLAKDLKELSEELGMDTLIEIHNAEELERALDLSPELLGVNNRNLKTLDVDLHTSYTLAERIPPEIFKISESGIGSAKEIKTLQSHGYQGFLIGESLMKEQNISQKLKNIIDTDQELK